LGGQPPEFAVADGGNAGLNDQQERSDARYAKWPLKAATDAVERQRLAIRAIHDLREVFAPCRKAAEDRPTGAP
jgi:hypothetical protein